MTSQRENADSLIFFVYVKNESLLTIMAGYKGLSGESATGCVNACQEHCLQSWWVRSEEAAQTSLLITMVH